MLQKSGARLRDPAVSRSFWDRVAGLYDLFEWSNRKVNTAARTRVGELVPSGARVLDCAAGTGEFSLAAAKRAASVLCTDQSEAMLARARKKVRKHGLSNVTFARRDLTALPDPDHTYDAAAAGNVLHRVRVPVAAQKRRADVLGLGAEEALHRPGQGPELGLARGVGAGGQAGGQLQGGLGGKIPLDHPLAPGDDAVDGGEGDEVIVHPDGDGAPYQPARGFGKFFLARVAELQGDHVLGGPGRGVLLHAGLGLYHVGALYRLFAGTAHDRAHFIDIFGDQRAGRVHFYGCAQLF